MWIRLIGITGLTQVLVQFLGFISGVLVIRLLPVEEYALYTLANTMLATMVLLADGGISTGVLSQGGKVWKDEIELGKVLSTGIYLKKRFAYLSIIVAFPILIYLLLRHDASWLTAILVALAIIPAFYAQFSDSLLTIVPKLHQNIGDLQKNQAVVSFGRLILTTLFLFIFPFTFLALLASGIPRIYGNRRLMKISAINVDTSQQKDPVYTKRIISTVKRLLPGIIYYCISGQITIWLLSFFGSTTSIAQIGALGRLAVVLSLLNYLTGTLLIPRFARKENKREALLVLFLKIMLVTIFFLTGIVLIVNFFPDQILWILGDEYTGLQKELTLIIMGSALNIVAGVAYSLNASRDWILNPLISISLSVLSIIVGIIIFDVSILKGVLYLNIFLAIFQILIYGSYSAYKLMK
nr:polysaccharide biosynthesis protein [Gramella oceanisediminis]